MEGSTLQKAVDIANGRREPATELEMELARQIVLYRSAVHSRDSEIAELKAEIEKLRPPKSATP